LREISTAKLQEAFETAYRALYGRIIPGMPIEILSWSLRVAAPAAQLEKTRETKERRTASACGRRDVFDAGSEKRLAYGVYERTALEPGASVSGPALIVEAQTTTVVTSSFDAVIDNARNIVLTRKAKA
jgi:N-methylhydantoinase A